MPEQQAGLLTAFEHEGVWWTPDNTSNRVLGTLSYDPGSGARLDLLGHLTPEQTAFSGTRIGSPTMTIHGLTKDGKSVTLDGVYTLDYQISPSTESFRSKRVLIGEHLEAPESSLFCFCQFRFTNMEEWLSTHAFKFGLKNTTEPYEFTLSCQAKSVSTYRVEPIGANLKTAGSFQTHDITPRHYGITVQSWFVLTPDERRSLSWYTDIITRMRNLAALVLDGLPTSKRSACSHATQAGRRGRVLTSTMSRTLRHRHAELLTSRSLSCRYLFSATRSRQFWTVGSPSVRQ